MTPERIDTTAEQDTDEEIRTKRLRDPEVRARVREIKERLDRGESLGSGISAEGLPDFLRERG